MKAFAAILGVVSTFFFNASYCEAQKIELVGVIVGLDNDQRVITLEQRRAVNDVIKSDMQIAKEAWADIALAVGDEVEASYDANIAMIVAISKKPPAPPDDIKRRQLRDAADLFLHKRKVLSRDLQQKQQNNVPLFQQWGAIKAQRWNLQQALSRAPKKIAIGDKLLNNPAIPELQNNLRACEVELARLQPEYKAAFDEEKAAIDAAVINTASLATAFHPIAGRDGLEQDKRESLAAIKADSPETWETDVWVAMLDLLDGDLDAAQDILNANFAKMQDAAPLVLQRNSLRPIPPPFTCETAHLYISALRLANQGSTLNKFVNKWGKFPPPDDKYHLVILKSTAARSICHGKWRQAMQSYRKAVKMVQPDEVGGRTYGEAALLFAACPEQGERNMEVAMDYAEKAIGICGDSCWEAYRAKAAVHAAKGEWDEASECLDVAGRSIPLVLAEDLKAQRLAYGAKQEFAVSRF